MGRVFIKSAEYAPQIDNAHAVELQLLDRCPPGGTHAQDQQEIWIPGEMIRPQMLTRMVKRDGLTGDSIKRVNTNVFATVAPLARQSEI